MSFLARNHAAVRHILSSPSIESRTARFVRAEDVDWGGLLEEARTMSDGERVVVDVAHDLWHADGTIGLTDAARRLDRRAFERVVEGLWISRGDVELDATLPAAA